VNALRVSNIFKQKNLDSVELGNSSLLFADLGKHLGSLNGRNINDYYV
jgi:hypothetical protein